MRRYGILIVLVLALSLPLAAVDGTKFTLDLSGHFLTRATGSAVPLVSLYGNEGTGNVFTTDDVALNTWKFGGDLRLGYTWSKFGVEVRGFMLAKWKKSKEYTSPEGSELVIETNPLTYYGMGTGNTLTASNESTLKGFEANLTYDLTPKVRLYGGARYLQVKEMFDLFGYFSEADNEDDFWTTTNKMLGGQIGARVEFLSPADEATRGFTVQGHGAIALFSNDAHADFTVVDYYSDIIADGHKLTPAVDAGVQVGYRLDRMIAFYVGYDLLWVDFVSQASRQVAGTTSYNSTPTIALVYKSLAVHGAKVGVTVHF